MLFPKILAVTSRISLTFGQNPMFERVISIALCVGVGNEGGIAHEIVLGGGIVARFEVDYEKQYDSKENKGQINIITLCS